MAIQYNDVTTAITAGKATNTVVKAGPGRLLRVLVTTAGSAAMLIYDHATTNSGTLVGTVPANTTAGTSYLIDMPVALGIVVKGDANNPAVTISYE